MADFSRRTKQGDSLLACLCCMCGTVSLESAWTYWKRNDEGDEWIPNEPGDYDPMMLCPACEWEHQDTDDGSGVYQGTLAEMEAQREVDLPEMAEWWASQLAQDTAYQDPITGRAGYLPRGKG